MSGPVPLSIREIVLYIDDTDAMEKRDECYGGRQYSEYENVGGLPVVMLIARLSRRSDSALTPSVTSVLDSVS